MNSPAKITFVDAVAFGLRNTTNFRGTASRTEFWYWVLFLALVRCATVTVDGFVYPADVNAEIVLSGASTDFGAVLSVLTTQIQHSLVSSTFAVELLLLTSTVAVTVRRLRDAGWKPWIALVAFASNYVGLALTVVVSTQILSVTTQASGPLDPEALIADIAGPMLAIIAIALINTGTSIATLIGALQRSVTVAND